MSDWPPKPEEQNNTTRQPQQPTGEEWKLLEKVIFSSVEEQRRTRRWGIFFKVLTFLYLFVILAVMGKGCSESKTATSPSGDHIAVVKIDGTIAANDKSVNSRDTIKSLNRAFENSSSKAIVLSINSPGGSPVQSDEIWQEIQYLKKQHKDKKVYAIVGDIGASGGYYIASAADEILVNPSSLIGSIGVIMPNYGVEDLLKKIGVEDRTMTAGDNKALMSMTQPIDPAQRAHMQSILDDVHNHFITAVKEGRGKKLKSEDPALFSGLFWTGDQAVKLGIADRIGNINTLKRELKTEKTFNYTVQRSPLEELLGGMGASIGAGIASALSQQIQAEGQAKLQ
jgi:protease IV